MSKTLSRQIRRIGLLPTTYKESTEQRLVTEIQNGKKVEVEKSITIRTPVRHREALSAQETADRRTHLVTEARAARKARKTGNLKKAA